MTKAQIIQSICDNFYQLPQDCMDEIMSCSKVRQLDKKIQLVKVGQYADKAYYIAQGTARAYLIKDGRDISDWFAFDREFISSIQSFFMNIPSPHFIETLEPTILLEMDRNNINRLSDQYRAFDRIGKIIVTQTMLKQQHRLASMQFETAQQKYDSLLELRPDIEMRVPLIHIASYLGITIETLSRIRNPKNRI